MPLVASQDIDTMRESVFFDGPEAGRKFSRFWVLLVLAAIIASAGVVADSTATVIGAMIVAPLMTPIQGTMLAVVIGDRANLARSIGLFRWRCRGGHRNRVSGRASRRQRCRG